MQVLLYSRSPAYRFTRILLPPFDHVRRNTNNIADDDDKLTNDLFLGSPLLCAVLWWIHIIPLDSWAIVLKRVAAGTTEQNSTIAANSPQKKRLLNPTVIHHHPPPSSSPRDPPGAAELHHHRHLLYSPIHMAPASRLVVVWHLPVSVFHHSIHYL